MSVVSYGTVGHLSILSEQEASTYLFDLDVTTGVLTRLSGFDAALEQLEVYPGGPGGHAYNSARQEVALIACPWDDYSPAYTERLQEINRWCSELDYSTFQQFLDIPCHGTTLTLRKVVERSVRQAKAHLFLLNAEGECRAVPGTQNAMRPLWSNDGTLLAFHRRGDHVSLRNTGIIDSLWVMRRADLALMRLGACQLSYACMHPSGVLLCRLDDESIALNDSTRYETRRLQAFALADGEVRPIKL